MMNKSLIEWTDFTWNPVTGCLHGCPYCYARRIAERFMPKGLGKEDLEGCFSSDYSRPHGAWGDHIAEPAFETFDEAVDYKVDEGWKSQRRDSEWEDVCPDCVRS